MRVAASLQATALQCDAPLLVLLLVLPAALLLLLLPALVLLLCLEPPAAQRTVQRVQCSVRHVKTLAYTEHCVLGYDDLSVCNPNHCMCRLTSVVLYGGAKEAASVHLNAAGAAFNTVF
jgi:hypothetical protein